MTHTPTPWKFSPWHIEEGPPAVLAPAGHIVCTTAGDDDAAFIVKACNMHAELVTALSEAIECYAECIAYKGAYFVEKHGDNEEIARLRSILAKAREDTP